MRKLTYENGTKHNIYCHMSFTVKDHWKKNLLAFKNAKKYLTDISRLRKATRTPEGFDKREQTVGIPIVLPQSASNTSHTAYISGSRDLRDLTNEVRAYERGETGAKKNDKASAEVGGKTDEEASSRRTRDPCRRSERTAKAAGASLRSGKIYFLFRGERAPHSSRERRKQVRKSSRRRRYICYNCAGDRIGVFLIDE